VDPSESRVTANGIDHHVVTWDGGSRGTVVIAHGFLDQAWSFDAVARVLAARGHRVVAFDWRGQGQSSHVGAGGYYHFPDYVLDLAELLPLLAPDETPHLVGHSMGGTASAMYAGTLPDTLRTLTLIEGLGPPPSTETAPERFAHFVHTVRKSRARVPRPMKDLEEAIARMRGQNAGLPDALARFLAEKMTTPAPGGDGILFRFDALHQTRSPMTFHVDTFRAFLDRISVPTLIVGATDGFRLADEAERVARIRDHRVVELDRAGHMMHWTAPDRLAAALLEFFAERGA
jgi:pimeloyl-ACP methyl ester carboxylesterase